jgi:glycosyltransferase involved in cell wall biosynthesis
MFRRLAGAGRGSGIRLVTKNARDMSLIVNKILTFEFNGSSLLKIIHPTPKRYTYEDTLTAHASSRALPRPTLPIQLFLHYQCDFLVLPHMRKKYFGTLMDADAGIIVLNDYANLFLLSKEIGKGLKRDIHIICGLWWSVEIPKLFCKIIFTILRNRVLYPTIKVSILCNTKREHKLLRLFGIDSVFCNHNCFIDENIFTNRPGAAKKYAAVYNAVLNDFKRHSLVAAIKGKVAFLTYRYENTSYKNHLDKTLTNISWLNYSPGKQPVFLDNAALVEASNESYAGLALSSVEGAMYASCEYLLCGIPVVSTRSKGGRDVFFDDYNSIIADAVPEQVSMAVERLKAANKDPMLIRAAVISRMKEHRQRFIKHVNRILQAKGLNYDIADTWDEW